MVYTYNRSNALRVRPVLWRSLQCALFAAILCVISVIPAFAASPIDFPSEPLVSVWEHDSKVDIAPKVKEIGFNTVWTHDKPYDSKTKLEDTLLYKHMNTPGVKYIIAKIERGIWGWKFDQAMQSAEWIAKLSLTEKRIIGVYLNDFIEEMTQTEKGGHSDKEFRQIIAKIKSINPRLAIFVPCYPPKELDQPFDYDIDAVIFSFYDTTKLGDHEALLDRAIQKFPGKPILGSLYLNAGSEGRWLTEKEFKSLMDFFVDKVNEGKLAGIRVFRVKNLNDKPEYVTWLKESLARLKRP
jgi:hypothetical protein